MKQRSLLLAIVLSVYTLNAAETFTDTLLGYTITLPDNWVREIEDSTHHRFVDTTQTYTAIIVIDRYDFEAETLYTSADEWTRANFIAYSFLIDADPFSSMVFYDTASTREAGVRWAADAYSIFYDLQTTSADLAEYIRYTAAGTWGYEIYAIGPLADMSANVGIYAAIIQGIALRETPGGVSRPFSSQKVMRPAVPAVPRKFDLLGRMEPPRSTRSASRLAVAPCYRFCMFR